MHARYYDPIGGRFLSLDPADAELRWPQSWNVYGYVMGNSVRFLDPLGLEPHPSYDSEKKTWVWRVYDAITVTARALGGSGIGIGDGHGREPGVGSPDNALHRDADPVSRSMVFPAPKEESPRGKQKRRLLQLAQCVDSLSVSAAVAGGILNVSGIKVYFGAQLVGWGFVNGGAGLVASAAGAKMILGGLWAAGLGVSVPINEFNTVFLLPGFDRYIPSPVSSFPSAYPGVSLPSSAEPCLGAIQ